MRCAAPRRLLSNNTVVIAGAFVIGALVFTIGTLMVQRERRGEIETRLEPVLSLPPWTAELAGTSDAVAIDLRVDMVERLAMIGEPWCAALLERARASDPDVVVRDAADNALIVIAARQPG